MLGSFSPVGRSCKDSVVLGLTQEPQPGPQANMTLQNGVCEKDGRKLHL